MAKVPTEGGGNNETFGQSVEKAICDLAGLDSSAIAHRSEPSYEALVVQTLREALRRLPRIAQHVGLTTGSRGGASKSAIDFRGSSGETISVKSNLKRDSGKVCPPDVGQPGMKVYREYFGHLYHSADFDDRGLVRTESFKHVAQARIVDKLKIYLNHLFECDYLLWVWLTPSPGHAIFTRDALSHYMWQQERFTFSRTPEEWNESCTIRYDVDDPSGGPSRPLTIGEYQVHNHRSNFKFRANLKNLATLIGTPEE